MRDDGRTLASDERAVSVERAVVWLVVVAVAAATAASVVLVADEVRRDVPDAEFSVSFDADSRTVTVEHAGGDPITDRVTRSLAVVVVDADGPTTGRVVWASDVAGPIDRGVGYPVTEGEAITIDDPTVDADGDRNFLDAEASVGFHLAASDAVRVVWTGSRFGGGVRTVVLANATVGGAAD